MFRLSIIVLLCLLFNSMVEAAPAANPQVVPFDKMRVIGSPSCDQAFDMSDLAVTSVLPKDYALNCIPRVPNRILVATPGIPEAICKEERKYSWRWTSLAIQGDFLRPALKEAFSLVRGIGGKDDGAFLSYTVMAQGWGTTPVHINVLDWRDLRVAVRSACFGSMNAIDIAKVVLKWYGYGDSLRSKIIPKESYDKEGVSYGRFTVDQGPATGWFTEPIEWFKQGDTVIFLFTKVVREAVAKGEPKGESIVGGIPLDDPRPWRRFEDSNRKQISEEYLKLMREKRKIDGTEREVHFRSGPKGTMFEPR